MRKRRREKKIYNRGKSIVDDLCDKIDPRPVEALPYRMGPVAGG